MPSSQALRITCLAAVVYSGIERERFENLITRDRSVAEALWREQLAETSVQREWAVNIGGRIALERVAHLLCELVERLRPVGLLDGKSCAFPVTQIDLADATGLSGRAPQSHAAGIAGGRPDRAT